MTFIVVIINNVIIIIIIIIGAPFGVWTGGYSCPGERVALLACVATGGYHSTSSYQWFSEEKKLDDEIYPILYATCSGTYSCVLSESEKSNSFTYRIDSMYTFKEIATL